MIRSLRDVTLNFPITRHKTRNGELSALTADGKTEGDSTMANRHAFGLGRSLLDCPDTDYLVEVHNASLEFSVNHPRLVRITSLISSKELTALAGILSFS
jgi:hypothetical protein